MIEIDISSPEPIYVQIISQIGLAIKNGVLLIGDQLPPIRQLANDLELNPNTIAKAYQILEEANIIETRGRSGSTISANANEAFERWLLQLSKDQLSICWNRLVSLSPSKDFANKIWKNSLKELRNE